MNIVTRQVFLHTNSNPSDGEALILSTKPKAIQGKNKAVVDESGDLEPPDSTYLDGIEKGKDEGVKLGEKNIFEEVPDKINLAILGAGGVGKSAITLRYTRNTFEQDWNATIEDAYRKNVRVDDEVSSLEILDTAGQEDFSTLRAQWMMDKDGYIFVYSLLDKASLYHLNSYIDLLEQVTVGMSFIPPVVFVGNKKDVFLDENNSANIHSTASNLKVTDSDVYTVIEKYVDLRARLRKLNSEESRKTKPEIVSSIPHYEASAYSGENIEELFECMVREIRKVRRPVTSGNGSCCVIA